MKLREVLVKTPEEIELEDARSVKLRYNSLVEAVQVIEAENNKFRDHISNMEAKLIHAQENVDINKNIVMNTVMNQNKMKDDFVLEINALKAKLAKVLEAAE